MCYLKPSFDFIVVSFFCCSGFPPIASASRERTETAAGHLWSGKTSFLLLFILCWFAYFAFQDSGTLCFERWKALNRGRAFYVHAVCSLQCHMAANKNELYNFKCTNVCAVTEIDCLLGGDEHRRSKALHNSYCHLAISLLNPCALEGVT